MFKNKSAINPLHTIVVSQETRKMVINSNYIGQSKIDRNIFSQ